MNPQEAAQWAESGPQTDAEAAGELGGEIGPVESGTDHTATQGLYESLWNTQPEEPLHMIESPWNPRDGGITRIYRGLMKMSDVDGLPAIVDITIGLAEELSSRNVTESLNRDSGADGGDDDGTDFEVLPPEGDGE